ncbi:MAG: cellulase family glycosylhydrolase [Butyrivibrio sp.]|nr:cellulase family glycosylhydrolase [Butyrivibrio sp.]
MKRLRGIPSIILLLSLILACFLPIARVSAAETTEYTHARPSANGNLSVDGLQLVDQNDNPVILRGLSLHGLTWFPEFVNNDLFKQLSVEWNCNMIRLPMYSDIYCENPKESWNLLIKGVDYAIANDMYVLVDWHILDDYDPNMHLSEATEFFGRFSAKYADSPYIIYEICNEPNRETTWKDVKTYSEQVIPIIRRNSPNSVIVVGTPNYDKDLSSAARDPLAFDNLMYVLHFYAATHGSDLRSELIEALDRNLPVFISECGISEASGDGRVGYKNAATWFGLLQEKGISYAVWSLSNKDESSALLYPSYNPTQPITDNDITPVGSWIKALIQGQYPHDIPIPITPKRESFLPVWLKQSLTQRDIIITANWPRQALYILAGMAVCLLLALFIKKVTGKKYKTYDTVTKYENTQPSLTKDRLLAVLRIIILLLSMFFTLMYLYWRVAYSIPWEYGVLATSANIILLIVEIFGFIESIILYLHLLGMKDHPLPGIADDEYPEVDIFIATYNEPTDLLEKTINACNHLSYPDKSKVHIWVCDDNRRPAMRELAEKMHVGYFDRPDNKGAKAGNLNHALGLTHAPYVVTLDADMLVKSDFLLKTIPYFVDNEKRNAALPREEQAPLGLIQTPQCFYEPDVFQYALYSEKNAPNEQDFFYRTIEVSKTSSNSVIYGGSNTVISRKALDKIGGFYTESITEDFATGLLIESNGFVSLGLPEPLASGKTPDTFAEHIKQRIRWGRGVISTARQLKIFRRKNLSPIQKMSYWSSVVYWYSPLKNLIYILSPLVFAVFTIPVFRCSWIDLLIFWVPMFILQDLCLRAHSNNAVSLKWSGIYETSVMPFLLVPVVKELFGITTKKFAVTDKSKKTIKRHTDLKTVMPYLILTALSIAGIVRTLSIVKGIRSLGLFILLFWLVRNSYFLIMSMFLVDGRDSDSETVHVIDAEPATIITTGEKSSRFDGITTHLTEHNLKIFLDEMQDISIGDYVDVEVESGNTTAKMQGVITGIKPARTGVSAVYDIEILDFKGHRFDYLQVLYDRVPTLPQTLNRDNGIIAHLLKNIAQRILEH